MASSSRSVISQSDVSLCSCSFDMKLVDVLCDSGERGGRDDGCGIVVGETGA